MDDGEVGPLDLVLAEQADRLGMARRRAGKHHHAASIAVEPMDSANPWQLRPPHFRFAMPSLAAFGSLGARVWIWIDRNAELLRQDERHELIERRLQLLATRGPIA